jgi:hypothetical protein
MKKTTKKEAKKVDLGKVTDAVKKIPAFLTRMKKELEKLISMIEKAEAMIAAWAGLSVLTKEQKVQKRLLEKQVKAMKAYRDALQARVDNEEKKL